jgi:hypothetical protein
MSGTEGPTWEDQLRTTVDGWVLGSEYVRQSAYDSFLRHIDAAYKRGLIAGRSQAVYPTRRKPSRSAPSADASSASVPEGAG